MKPAPVGLVWLLRSKHPFYPAWIESAREDLQAMKAATIAEKDFETLAVSPSTMVLKCMRRHYQPILLPTGQRILFWLRRLSDRYGRVASPSLHDHGMQDQMSRFSVGPVIWVACRKPYLLIFQSRRSFPVYLAQSPMSCLRQTGNSLKRD